MPKPRPRFASERFATLVEAAGSEISKSIRQSAVISDHHPSSGAVREEGFRSFLRRLLSQKYFVGSGFAFDARDNQSRQLDIVIAQDPPFVRVFETGGLCYLPCEVVLAVIEVKKTLSIDELRSCMKNAASLRQLRPFGTHRFTSGRLGGEAPVSKEHRCFYDVVALSSDLALEGWAQKEWDRLAGAAAEVGEATEIVDRVVVLDRGLINSRTGQALESPDNASQNLFDLFIHLSNHLDKESRRRPEFDLDIYTTGQPWRKLKGLPRS